MGRKRIVLSLLALVLCLALVGRWALWSRDSLTPGPQATSIGSGTASVQPPAVAAPKPPAAPAANSSSSNLAALRGRVLDAVTGEPVREFTLELHDIVRSQMFDDSPDSRVFRARDGRFEWQGLHPRSSTLIVRARGYQHFELNKLQISKGEAARELVLPLRPGYSLRGRVYDEVSGAGIAAASIGFREAGVGRVEAMLRTRDHVTSAQDGSFVVESLPPGRVSLTVHAPGFASRDVEVVADGPPVQVGLSAGGTIAGRITAADGVVPVAGQIILSSQNGGLGYVSRTGAAGTFSFAHLPAGRYRLTGQAEGATIVRDVALARNQHLDDIVLALPQGRSIRGVVTGLRPEDRGRVAVSLWMAGVSGPRTGYAPVDDEGRYVLRGAQPGSARLFAESLGRRLSKTIQVPTDADLTVDFSFPRGSRLSGHVTRAGKPLADVRIRAQPLAETEISVNGQATGSDGTYTLDDLPGGEYIVWAGSYRSGPIQLSQDTVFDIDVPLAQLAGRVVEATGKEPVVGVDVDVWRAAPGSPRIRLHEMSDHFGQFAFVGLEPGDFVLTAYKAGFELFRERISYAAPAIDMTIRLRPDSGVEIKARDADSGQPLRVVYAIELTSDGEENWLELRLDENGEGYVPGQLAGDTVTFAASGYVPLKRPAWGGERLDLRLKAQSNKQASPQ